MNAQQFLRASESGHLESILDDGLIVVMIDLNPVLHVPALPTPQISVTPGNAVVITSDEIEIARIDAETQVDAELIADSLVDCFENPA